MKKTLLPLCLLILLSACGASGTRSGADAFGRRNVDLMVFADASLSGVLEDIAGRYEQSAPWVRTQFLFASSGDLSRRIRDGAQCDVFLSAASAPMDALDGSFRGDLTRNPDRLSLLLSDTRVNLTRNRVVLAVPLSNPDGIRNFAHISAVMRRNGLLLATADAGDPLGVCAERIFDYYSLDRSVIASGFTLAADAKEALTRIQSGAADGGILYQTDADGLLIVDTAEASVCGDVTYCGAVLSGSAAPLAASAFLEYLTGAEASERFARAGFAPLSEESPDAEPWDAEAYPETAEPWDTGEYWEAALPEEPESVPDAESWT